MTPFDRPVAVVTGAGRGIGAATAHRLSENGFHVVVADVDDKLAAAVADEVGGTAAHVDVTDPDEVARLSATLDRVDALINNAGIFPPAPIATVSVTDFRRVLDVNVVGPLLMTQGLLPQLSAAQDAAIVNVASIAAKVVTPGTAAYSPSKAAVVSLTKLCAVELADRGIRVNAVAPGGIKTEGTASVSADPSRESRFNNLIPAGRRGGPYDIADVIPFFVGPQSRYVTGQVLYIDGGLTEATINFLRAAQDGH